MIIFDKSGSHQYDRMKRAFEKEMFKNFPGNPLATIIWIIRSGKIPTDIEFELILKKLSESINVNDLSGDMDDSLDDLTMTEDLDDCNSRNKTRLRIDLKTINPILPGRAIIFH